MPRPARARRTRNGVPRPSWNPDEAWCCLQAGRQRRENHATIPRASALGRSDRFASLRVGFGADAAHLVGARNPPHNEYSKQLVEEWNKAHSNTPIHYEFFAMTPYFKKLTAALSTRSAADMFTVIDTLLPSFTTKNVLGPIRPEWLGYKDLEDMKK